MEQDTLDRTASTFGITDVEFDEREEVLAKGFTVEVDPIEYAEYLDELDPFLGEKSEGQLITEAMNAIESRPAPLGW